MIPAIAKSRSAACGPDDHGGNGVRVKPPSDAALDRAARLFRAIGDPPRLRLLALLAQGEACVTELAAGQKEGLSTVSQRLRVLRAEELVARRREGKHILYRLADQHVADLVFNALEHAREHASAHRRPRKELNPMHKIHEAHSHIHGVGCGHLAIRHGDHVDYLHDGCLHSEHDDHFDEHIIEVSEANPAACTQGHACGGHAAGHVHGDLCGHQKVPHGDHFDYLVNGHLHHAHDGHCDDHGRLSLA